MLNRRSFCIRSVAASVAGAVAVHGEVALAAPAKAAATAAGIPVVDEATSRALIFDAYRKHAAERAALGIPPLPLNAQQTAAVTTLLRTPPKGEEAFLLDLIGNRVPPGVDDAARVKAEFLGALAQGKQKSPLISRQRATELLATMQGG